MVTREQAEGSLMYFMKNINDDLTKIYPEDVDLYAKRAYNSGALTVDEYNLLTKVPR
tara:strand:- start:471 stop:641 length:171 start_codon:yes stop_codon:yes gene_type:complete